MDAKDGLLIKEDGTLDEGDALLSAEGLLVFWKVGCWTTGPRSAAFRGGCAAGDWTAWQGGDWLLVGGGRIAMRLGAEC